MYVDELEEYQQNEIDGVVDAIEDRRDHITGPFGRGLLDGEKLGEHQNGRLEAYLEGYADAMAFAMEKVEAIENMARYAPEVTDDESDVYDPAGIDDESVRETMKVLITEARSGNYGNVRVNAESLAELLGDEDGDDDE